MGSARLARLIGGLGVVVLGVAGCVSMPNAGPANQYAVNQSDTGQGQDFIGPIPASPMPNATPAQIVQGFLFANAGYYTASGIAQEFLTPAAQKTWNPRGSVTVFRRWDADNPSVSTPAHANGPTSVTISGQVQARLNGAGQPYSSAAQGNAANAQATQSGGSCSASSGNACYTLTLVKLGGQWRIAKPPPDLLVWQGDFQRAWATQDLYFFNFDAGNQVLVPDSVFVPIGTSEGELLNNLANALKPGPAPGSLLSGAIGENVFPSNVSVSVQVAASSVAVVNLHGTLTSAERNDLQYVEAELVWTLTSASESQTQIQSVELQVNGSDWGPQPRDRQMYEAYDPYPSESAAFIYVNQQGEPESRCGSLRNAAVGGAIPLFEAGGATALAQCSASSSGASAPAASATPSATATQPGTSGRQGGKQGGKAGSTTGHGGKQGQASKPGKPATYSMVAVSPGGNYAAVVSAGGNSLSIGALGGHSSFKPVFSQPGITSISWDRQNDVWLTQEGNVWMVPANGGKPYEVGDLPDVNALSVAPDGVRVALLLAQNVSDSDSDLELVAINPSGNQSSQQVPRVSGNGPYVGTPVLIGPGITDSVALAWYNADNLVVVGPASTALSGELEEVPVDGRAGSGLTAPQTPPSVTVQSIAAGNSANMLVAGLSNHQLEVSVGSQAPWQNVTSGSQVAYGVKPSYWIQPAS